MLITHGFDYYSCIIYVEIRKYDTSSYILPVQDGFSNQGLCGWFYTNFRIIFFHFCEKCSWNFDVDCNSLSKKETFTIYLYYFNYNNKHFKRIFMIRIRRSQKFSKTFKKNVIPLLLPYLQTKINRKIFSLYEVFFSYLHLLFHFMSSFVNYLFMFFGHLLEH